MSTAGRAAGAGGRGLPGREPAGPAAAGRESGAGERAGRAGHGSLRGGRSGGRAGRRGERGALGEGGRAPLELFCQPPYLWAEYFRGGEGVTVGKGWR